LPNEIRAINKAQRFIQILCYVTAAGLGGGAIRAAWACAVCLLEEHFKKLKILPLQSQYKVSLLLFVVDNGDYFMVNSEIHNTNLLLLPLALQPAVGFGLSKNTSPFSLSIVKSIQLITLLDFRNNNFLLCGVVSPTPNPQPRGPGFPFCLGHHP